MLRCEDCDGMWSDTEDSQCPNCGGPLYLEAAAEDDEDPAADYADYYRANRDNE